MPPGAQRGGLTGRDWVEGRSGERFAFPHPQPRSRGVVFIDEHCVLRERGGFVWRAIFGPNGIGPSGRLGGGVGERFFFPHPRPLSPRVANGRGALNCGERGDQHSADAPPVAAFWFSLDRPGGGK